MNTATVGSIKESAKELPFKHEPKHSKHLDIKLYKEIMHLFMKKLVYKLIKTGKKIKFPSRIGSLQLTRYDKNKLRKKIEGEGKVFRNVDFHATKLLKARGIDKTVRHNLKATGGFWWRLIWSKIDDANFRHKRLYCIKLSRPNIRPNSYNKVNPELSIVPFFRDIGWEFYREITFRI